MIYFVYYEMDIISSEEIVNMYNITHPNFYPHPTTVIYLQALLLPYITILNHATNIDSIIQWIPMAFLPEHSHSISSNIERLPELYIANKQDTRVLTSVKNTIIKYLLTELIELSWDIVDYEGERYIILPWDILRAITDSVELAEMFGVTPKEVTFPVTVTIGRNQYVYNVCQDLVMGILLFSGIIGVDFELTLLGIRLYPGLEQFCNPNDPCSFRYLFNRNYQTNYQVTVNNITYWFDIAEFMQGIVTAAQWANIDHHRYWNNLLEYYYDIHRQEFQTINITF